MHRPIMTTCLCVLLLLAGAVAADAAEAASLRDKFQSVNPAVVVIHTAGRHADMEAEGGLTSISGIGSGFVISDDGLVVTAAHVVQAADEVIVEFLDEEKVPARVVKSDPSSDLALLRLESVPAGIATVELGDSDLSEIGDQVFIIGAPYGVGHTLTVGYISGRHRPDTQFSGMFAAEMLQTDAAINQGNSGGPMFNMDGDVIGVVSHIMSQSGGSEGVGFVITSNLARRLLLEEPGIWSGLEGTFLAGELAKVLNVPEPGAGMLVQRVAKDSLAEKLGLRAGSYPAMIADAQLILGGDIILKVGDAPMTDPKWIRTAVKGLRPGKTLRLTILRGGKKMQLIHQLTAADLGR